MADGDYPALYSDINRIVNELFVDTADNNYILARRCHAEGLIIDFLWLSVHALEKYMKAVLLLNGVGAKKQGHDICRLYRQVSNLASDLLPEKLEKPADLVISYWHTESPAEFIKRLYKYGRAHNRYNVFGFQTRSDDLHKVDQMVFAIRRLCNPLDAHMFPKVERTHRDILASQPDWWQLSFSRTLEKTIAGKRGDQLRFILLNLNLSFAPDDFEHMGMKERSSTSVPVLYRAIHREIERGDAQRREHALRVRDWVTANIKLPPDVLEELKALDASDTTTRSGGLSLRTLIMSWLYKLLKR